ncbi:hypothetical protein LTR28_007822, partial [Elasticomyces elasticus]
MVSGQPPQAGQRVVYVDGGFDLFSSGHIEFLRRVVEAEEGKAYVVVGVHDDNIINEWKGINYPIMNVFERGLCVLQCKFSRAFAHSNDFTKYSTVLLKPETRPARTSILPMLTNHDEQYINALIFSAPFTPSKPFLTYLPYGCPAAVYHGPTSFIPLDHDPYTAAKSLGVFRQIPAHAFAAVNAESIVGRILESRARYEARQRAKGEKGAAEEAVRRRESLENNQAGRERRRTRRESQREEVRRRESLLEVERGFAI